MFDEDLDAFFEDDEHGDMFIIQKNGETFNGIFDNEYVSPGDISGSEPVIVCKTEDVENLQRNDVLERGSDLYTFILQEPDGTGVSRVILESA